MTKRFLTGNEAFAHAALEAGVRVCAGYPGTPSSEVIETVAAAHAAGAAQGVHVEWSTNEKAALELLAGAAYAGARTLYTCKQVGLNVASDALMSLNYVGVKGGTVLFVADDPGPISSQTEQDTRRFAAFAKVPVFDPATPEQGCAMMKAAFDLSERHQTPAIVRPTTRICHASTYFDVEDETHAREPEGFAKDSRWVIFPKRSYAAHGEINERLPRIAAEFSGTACEGVALAAPRVNALSSANAAPGAVAAPSSGFDSSVDLSAFNPIDQVGEAPVLGIVAGGVSYAYVREALAQLAEEAADGLLVTFGSGIGFGAKRGDVDGAGVATDGASGLVGASDPRVADEPIATAAPVSALPPHRLMQVGTPYPFPADRAASFAEGLSDIIVFEELDHVLEDEMLRLAGRIHAPYRVWGKLTGHTTDRGENSTAAIADQLRRFFGLRLVEPPVSFAAPAEPPARPPLLCPGCPHRGAFFAVKLALRRPADGIFCGDIGCYTLGNAKPLNAVDTCLCMGAGITVAQGFSVVEPGKKALAFVGDSTFFASGMTGVANAVYNQHDVTIVVLDNATTAMTGSQPHPGTGVTLMGPKSEPISIEGVLRSLGVRVITKANPLRFEEAVAAARVAIDFDGPSAVIYEAPCVKLIKPSAPVRVDTQACTGCGRCVLKLGCPALSWNAEERRPVVDESLCNGCGLCIDVCADAALSCEACMPQAKASEGGAR